MGVLVKFWGPNTGRPEFELTEVDFVTTNSVHPWRPQNVQQRPARPARQRLRGAQTALVSHPFPLNTFPFLADG